MVHEISLAVTLVRLVDRIPTPPPPQRGRPRYYAERLFLKALVIMIIKQLHSPYELLTVLAQGSPGAWLTLEAKESLQRLTRQTAQVRP